MAVPHELTGHVECCAFFYAIEDLLVAGFKADHQDPKAVGSEVFEGLVVDICASIARPGEFEPGESLADFDSPSLIDSEGIVIKKPFTGLRKELHALLQFSNDCGRALGAIFVSPDGLRPKAKGTFGGAAAPGVERHIGMKQIADEVIVDVQIFVIDRENAWQGIRIEQDLAFRRMAYGAIGCSVSEAFNLIKVISPGQIETGIIKLVAAHEIEHRSLKQSLFGNNGDMGSDKSYLCMRIMRFEGCSAFDVV